LLSLPMHWSSRVVRPPSHDFEHADHDVNRHVGTGHAMALQASLSASAVLFSVQRLLLTGTFVAP
jgi:hypothetical protein